MIAKPWNILKTENRVISFDLVVMSIWHAVLAKHIGILMLTLFEFIWNRRWKEKTLSRSFLTHDFNIFLLTSSSRGVIYTFNWEKRKSKLCTTHYGTTFCPIKTWSTLLPRPAFCLTRISFLQNNIVLFYLEAWFKIF